ncbi:MAG: thiamine pyrophosphate-dependent dehydrogenase E1 component subunit alpha [Verrucomicrobia bacterium]|nr:thiamine pyrophosphate-dependent dehydrogenase E1 component subunit alpha [Verrucomicrobiota bacterium]
MNDATSLFLLRVMLTTRAIEERLIRLYHQGRIFGGVYTGFGQEASGAAVAAIAAPNDLFAPCIRNLSLHIGRGASPRDLFRQWLGRADGPTGGRDGNVHFGNLDHGVYAMISHLGAMISVVSGGVMARRYQGMDSVGFAFIGDGATSTGDFHEAVNFAAVREVPLMVVVENNHYAYSTPNASQFRCRNLVDKAAGYGIEGIALDGNDAIGLTEALAPVVADLREKPRTVLVEVDTMRMRGHGEHDDFSYVPRELLAAYAARDPLTVCREILLARGLIDPPGLEALEAEVQQAVDEAQQAAFRDPPPSPSTLLKGVYAGE